MANGIKESEQEQELLREVISLRSKLSENRRESRDERISSVPNFQELESLENLPKLEVVRLLKAHSGRIHQACWSPHDDIVLSVGADSFVCLWDVRTGLIRNLVDTTLNQATCADCTPDLDIVYCGGLYANVEAFTVTHRSAEDGYSQYNSSLLFEHGGRINSIKLLDDRRLLTTAASDGAVLWDIDKVKIIEKFNHKPAEVLCAIPLTPDGQNFITGASDGVPRVWDRREAAALVSAMSGHESDLTCIEMLPNQTSFVTGSDDSCINLYDLRTDCPIAQYHRPQVTLRSSLRRSVLSENFSSETGGGGGGRGDWSRSTAHASEGEIISSPGVAGLGVSQSGRIVISGCRDSVVCIWDLCETMGPVDTRKEHGPVVSLQMAHKKHAFTLLTWDPKTKLQIIRPN